MHSGKELTPMLVFAIFSGVLGMFQFGYNTGVINSPEKVLEEFIATVYKNRTGNWITEELRDVIWSLTVSIFAIGGMFGGLLTPTVANWCGRKTGLVLNNTIAVLGATLMSSSQLSQSIESLIIGRFIIGLSCGISTVLVPMYLSEIATVNLRGALGTVSQLGVTLGLLFSQVLGLDGILGSKERWPFLFGFAFVPAIFQLVMLPFCPESPRYLLLSCNRVSEARSALRRLRNSVDIEDDIEEMKAEQRAHQEEERIYGKITSIRELFKHPWLRTPLLIGIMMHLSQQLSGINAILYYSTRIFQSAEVPEDFANYATMCVGIVMVIMALVSIPLMDRLGRRTLHLYGLAGMFLASIFLTISLLVRFLYDWMKYISVISTLFYTLFFGIGPGSIPFMITTELFTQGTRPAAVSVAMICNYFANFVVGLTFPLLDRTLQSYRFLPFTVFLAIFWVFTYKKLPETKNRTFEEIAALFKPIQHTGSSPGITDYGCNLANVGSTNEPISPGSLEAPGANGSMDARTNRGVSNAYKVNRFNFDTAAAKGELNNAGQQQLSANYIDSLGCCNQGYRGSQGNIHHLPYTSCTSIAQNLSTNDQQPLIVDAQQDRHNQKCFHSRQVGDRCCLQTTSFMGMPSSSCTCCEGELKTVRAFPWTDVEV